MAISSATPTKTMRNSNNEQPAVCRDCDGAGYIFPVDSDGTKMTLRCPACEGLGVAALEAATAPQNKSASVCCSGWLGRITVDELNALAAIWAAVAGGDHEPEWVTDDVSEKLLAAGLVQHYRPTEGDDVDGETYVYEVSELGARVAEAWEHVAAAMRPNNQLSNADK